MRRYGRRHPGDRACHPEYVDTPARLTAGSVQEIRAPSAIRATVAHLQALQPILAYRSARVLT
jgi:hypothetical protein